jgi:hypothetical protein
MTCASARARPPLTDLRILMRGPPEVVTKQIEGMAGPIITFDPPARPFEVHADPSGASHS